MVAEGGEPAAPLGVMGAAMTEVLSVRPSACRVKVWQIEVFCTDKVCQRTSLNSHEVP